MKPQRPFVNGTVYCSQGNEERGDEENEGERGEGGGITEHYERRLFSEETMAKTDAGVDGVWELLEKKGKKTANQKGKAEK